MKPPKGLGNRGRGLFASVAKALPEGFEFDEREVAILTMAARQADDVLRLEGVIRKKGPMVSGSAGQPVVNPAVIEARQGRLAINRLLGELSIPDQDAKPRTAASRRGETAANARWDEAERRGEARRGAS